MVVAELRQGSEPSALPSNAEPGEGLGPKEIAKELKRIDSTLAEWNVSRYAAEMDAALPGLGVVSIAALLVVCSAPGCDADESPPRLTGTSVVGGGGSGAGGASAGGTTPCTPPCCTSHGDCAAPEICGGAGTPGVCGDQPGPIFDVPHAGIADHGDLGTVGSIAWRLQYLTAGQSARLIDDTPYDVGSTLEVPVGASLVGQVDASRTIVASAALDRGTLIRLAESASLQLLAIDGAHHPAHLVAAAHVSDVRIEDCHLRATKNDWAAGSDPRCHAVVFTEVADGVIDRNTIEAAGYPKEAPQTWPGICAGVYAPRNTNLSLRDNTIRNTLTAGIDCTGTLGAVIADNWIERTGRNNEYWLAEYDLPVADGITAYHNLNGFSYQEIYVQGNTVVDSGNHGMHLSGRDVHIVDNHIIDPFAQGILLADQRDPPDCASHCFIENNQVDGLLSGGNRHVVYVGQNYKLGTIAVSGNTPDDVYWRPDSACQ